jgi:hypothetical protein
LEASTYLDDSLGFESGQAAADRLLKIQRDHGILRGAYDDNWEPANYYCLTGNAQVAIIWLRLFDLTGETKYRKAARQTISFLKTNHLLKGPNPIRGGIKGSHPIWGKYMYLRYPNWAAKFFADAIMQVDALAREQ